MYYESVFIFSGQLTQKAANDKFIELKSVIEDPEHFFIFKISWTNKIIKL